MVTDLLLELAYWLYSVVVGFIPSWDLSISSGADGWPASGADALKWFAIANYYFPIVEGVVLLGFSFGVWAIVMFVRMGRQLIP